MKPTKSMKEMCGKGGPGSGSIGASFGLPSVPGMSNFASNSAGLSSIAPSTKSMQKIAKTPSFKAPKMSSLPNIQNVLGARTTATSQSEQRLKVGANAPSSIKSKRNVLTRLVRKAGTKLKIK